MKISPWVLLMPSNHRVPMVSSAKNYFYCFRCIKRVFSSTATKSIILKIKKKIRKHFEQFRTSISTGNCENKKYVGNEKPYRHPPPRP